MTYFFSPTTVMLCGLLALPLLAQAQTCVQNNLPSNPTAVYTVHGDGTVTDRRTGLMWAQCLVGQSGTQCATGTPIPMDWAAALAYAQSQTLAGYHDWRLPSAKELRTLVEHCRTQPAINEDIFPAQTFDPIAEQGVWTATPDVRDASRAWYIDFETGAQGKALRSTADRHTVRLVRGGLSLLPQWSGVALSGSPTAHSATIVGTSNLAGTGYWLVVPSGSAAPTPAQVRAQAVYGGVTPVTPAAQGSAVLLAATPTSFTVTGLMAATAYDFYLVAEAAGQLSAQVQKIAFSTAAAPPPPPPPPGPDPIDGACGTSHGQTLTVAPQANLCVSGTPSSVSGSGPWSWSCSGQYGGRSASCSASIRSYLVTATAGQGGRISPAQRSVEHGKSTSFSVQADSGWRIASVSGCNGSLTGTSYFIASVSAACTVQASFVATTTQGPVRDEDFVRQQYQDLLHRSADGAGLAYWSEQLRTGQISRAELVQRFFASQEFQGRLAPLVRLYFAYFQRIPDYAGLQYWIGAMYPQGEPSGLSLQSVSQAFAASPEFERSYSALGEEDFVRLVYQNVLGREPDAAGQAHWVGQLQRGLSRGALMLQFSESAEYQAFHQGSTEVVMTYVGLLRRAPEQTGFDHWLAQLQGGASIVELIESFLRSPEYNRRFEG